ncbi:hypothetical protein PZA11_007267 [Diplocarpon coronariae]
MAARRMNVLVYSGSGSTIESLKHCLYSLRRLLSPNYAVIPVTNNVILNEPWTASCALLVFPGGADLGYCRSLNGEGNRRIEQYVRRGGAYLGFCAGGYYGSSRCEFEIGDRVLEVVGPRELSFFPGVCRGCAFKGFVYHSEAGAKAVDVKVNEGAFKTGIVAQTFRSYYNGGGVFVDAGSFASEGVEVLADYSGDIDVRGGSAAVVYCKVGDGSAILTGPHPEFAAVNLDAKSNVPNYAKLVEDLAEDDGSRVNFLRACLARFGLIVSDEATLVPSLSRLHLSSMHHHLIPELLASWKDIISIEDGEEYIKGENDTFHLEKRDSRWSVSKLVAALPPPGIMKVNESSPDNQTDGAGVGDRIVDYDAVTKCLIPHESEWPGAKETPYFNHNAFYANLRAFQEEKGAEAEEFGKHLMYGEVVTSTNTLLEKNPQLLSRLPPGFTITATTQVAGRGRGSNVWVSPAGCLIFSTTMKHPMGLSSTAPVVFIQYLAAIAVAEGIQSYDRGYQDVPVKLKWPNDIYAQDPTKPGRREYVKIGGILVNSSYSSGNYDLVVGIGLNTTNAAPTTSLNALLSAHQAPFTLEKLLARILTRLETIYRGFCRTGFDRTLEETYYQHWLHTEQIVTLEAEGGVRARVKGITRDWGLLRAEELGWEDRPTGKIWEVQSDGNSFDFFKGLLKRKV